MQGGYRASYFCLVLALASTLGSGGCARYRSPLTTPTAPIPEDGVVFVADGAGNYQYFSKALRQASREGGFSAQIVTYEWSHGYMRMVADQIDYSHARAKGKELAQRVLRFKEAYPHLPVHLAGHSAGAMVVIAALECLPPYTVDNAVLISPTLSAFYDVRPALKGVRHGMYNFHSEKDWVYCGIATRVFGTSDRKRTVCSGRVGFHVPACPDEVLHLQKLRQRAWSPEDTLTGNEGGHFGNYESLFLQQNILPLFERMR